MVIFNSEVKLPEGNDGEPSTMAIEIVDLPINSIVIFQSYVSVYQRVEFFCRNTATTHQSEIDTFCYCHLAGRQILDCSW